MLNYVTDSGNRFVTLGTNYSCFVCCVARRMKLADLVKAVIRLERLRAANHAVPGMGVSKRKMFLYPITYFLDYVGGSQLSCMLIIPASTLNMNSGLTLVASA